MKNLFTRIYWWLTENAYNEGVESGITIGEIVQKGRTARMVQSRKCNPDCQCDPCGERTAIVELLIGKPTIF
jgi:hypothetical protein